MNLSAWIVESDSHCNRASRIAWASMYVLVGLTVASAQMIPLQPNCPGVEVGQQRSAPSLDWKSPARLHQGFLRASSGTLNLDPRGIQFLRTSGNGKQWAFIDIKSLDLRPNRMVLTVYDNRRWLLPELRQFKFTFERKMTPAIAALLAREINKPTQNRIPDPNALAIAVIAVRRSRHLGGSNGLLRIRDQGIDFVTGTTGQSRSWRWMDIQTMSHPDPYQLFIFGYKESYAFDLKEPMTRTLFNHLSDEIWTHNDSDWESTNGQSVSNPSAQVTCGPSKDE